MSHFLEDLAQKIAAKTGFERGELLHKGFYYERETLRDLIFAGTYQGKPAVLKVYNDPRFVDEPDALKRFQKYNRSRILKAPHLYAGEVITPHKGWLIMERLPKGGAFFASPMDRTEQKEFLELYYDYRQHFPTTSARKLTFIEDLPASEFHAARVSRWLDVAIKKEQGRVISGKRPLLDPEDFLGRYQQALALVRSAFKDCPTLWCHGHFVPREVYRTQDGKYYLLDFAHSGFYPQGYELTFIMWSDYLMAADWKLPYREWKRGIDIWLDTLSRTPKIRFRKFDALIQAGLVERTLGTILADITASDMAPKEARARLKLLYQFLDDLVR